MAHTMIAITPETKVGALLKAYPQLEPVLIDMAPEFRQLKNPILRKTVARVATLRQIAKIGGMALSDLINRLRNAAGIDETFESDKDDTSDRLTQPTWFDESRISDRLDIRPLLEAGEHPLGLVMGRLKQLGSGHIFELISSFEPAPLIDQAQNAGYHAWTNHTDDQVVVYFMRRTNN